MSLHLNFEQSSSDSTGSIKIDQNQNIFGEFLNVFWEEISDFSTNPMRAHPDTESLLPIITIVLLRIITLSLHYITSLFRHYYLIITKRKSCNNDCIITCYVNVNIT